jgi:protease-4
MWENSVQSISEMRGVDAEELNMVADGLLAQNPESALEHKIVDALLYYDEFLGMLADEIGVETVMSDNLISTSKYSKAKPEKSSGKRSKNKIAVVFAEGDIVQGSGDDGSIGSEKLAREIRNLRLDDNIKAVVLRVNSPGGDGLASDIILREVALTKDVKPIVVSMGNLAASGGYYISCAADKIVANATTLTGSIGVFGVIPNFQGFFNEKLGVTFDGVKTNENAEFISVTEPMTDYQKAMMKNEIERFYNTFIGHVAKGRGMTPEQVDAIAQGRVWTGSDAIEIGLVDEMGGLNQAIELAADLAGLEDYRTVDYPAQKEPFQQIIDELFGDVQSRILENQLGEHFKYFEYVNSLKDYSGIQARLPYEIEIK